MFMSEEEFVNCWIFYVVYGSGVMEYFDVLVVYF